MSLALLLALVGLPTAPLAHATDAPPAAPSAVESATAPPAVSDAGASDHEEGANPFVRYEENRVTLRASNVPLAAVLLAIGEQSGAAVRGPAPEREITMEFETLPLHKALARLLDKNSFMLTYGPDGKLRAIELVGAGPVVLAQPAPGATATPEAAATHETPSPDAQAAAPAETPPDDTQSHSAFLLRTTVDVSGPLAMGLGTATPSAAQLLDAAFRHPSKQLRAQAQRAALDAFAANPEIEKSYYVTLRPLADQEAAERMRRMYGRHAEEFLEKLAEQAKTPELRAKAAAIAEKIRAIPAT